MRDVAMAVEDDRDQLAPNLVPLMSVGTQLTILVDWWVCTYADNVHSGGRHSDNEQAVLPGTFHVHAAVSASRVVLLVLVVVVVLVK